MLGDANAAAKTANVLRRSVRETIDWLKQRNIDVVLIGLQYTPNLAKNRMYSAVRDMLRRIAREEGILYVRRFEAMRYISTARSQLVTDSGDGLHLNDIGFAAWLNTSGMLWSRTSLPAALRCRSQAI